MYYWICCNLCIIIFLSIVLAILQKHYTRLAQCLPQDCGKTINKARKLGVPADFLDKFIKILSPELFNEAVTGKLMHRIKEDNDALNFCNAMDNLSDDVASKKFIATVRNGM